MDMETKICVNNIVRDTENENQYLILWIAPGNDYGYWYDLNSRSRKPKVFQLRDIIQGEHNGKYEIESYSPPINIDEIFSEKELAHRERIWDLIQSAVETEPDIYDNKLRLGILRRIADERGIKPNNLYELLDRYWRSGKTKNAFLPRYSNCGGKGIGKNYSKKTGRPETSTITTGKILTDTDHKNFEYAIKKYYLNQDKRSLKSTYEKLLQDYYTQKYNNSKLKLLEPSEIPSFRQFQYWYYKNRNIVNETKKRSGEKNFELESRAVLGKSDYGLMGPGAQYQIDATVGDIYLVSQFDSSNLIGRPVIYFVIDAFSRMVTGMSVTLEGPSWAGAMTALANMATDKVAYCKEYGIEITENEWSCHHVPASILGDRGEMISKNADNLVNMLGIRIVNAPPYRADLKGIIEQHFHTINTNSIALLPGSVKPDMSKRGGKDYRLDASLDIRRFTQIIIKCVLYYNNHHYMEYFEKSEAMMRDNVDAIPCRIWEWGIRNCSGTLRSFPEEMVRMAVLPTDKATVTEKGIKFKGLFYGSDRAVREAWFEKARSGKSWSITVSYDPRDMANLYIWNQEDKKYDACYLLEWNQKYAGKYLDEIIYEQKKEYNKQKQLKLSETEAKVNLNAEIDSIVDEAKQMGKSVPVKSKNERVSNIRENRAAERAAILNSENGIETLVPPQNKPKEEMSPIIRMIKEKAEEKLKND